MGQTIFIVDDDPNVRTLITRWLEKANYSVKAFADAASILEGVTKAIPDVICVDLHLPDINGLDLVQQIHSMMPKTPLIMLTGDTDTQNVVTAIQNGAHDYLVKPVDKDKFLTVIRNAVEKNHLQKKITKLERKSGNSPYPEIVGSSDEIEKLFTTLDQLQSTQINVLIHGESGTGKELVAKAIHQNSSRKSSPFVAINCAAIAENLEDSEFFGHEKGAFTGANTMRKGRLEEAHTGTLFLDEIAELPLHVQAKLLRVLQEKTFQRVGGSQTIASDFRLICASHKDLESEVAQGRFREDLYYRLVVFEISVPSLRQRKADIAELVRYFLKEIAQASPAPEIASDVINILQQYDWPGNIRQLQNTVQRMYVTCNKKELLVTDIPPKIMQTSKAPTPSTTNKGSMEDIEKQAIIQALQETGGNLTLTMKKLGMARTTLYRKIKKFGIQNHE